MLGDTPSGVRLGFYPTSAHGRWSRARSDWRVLWLTDRCLRAVVLSSGADDACAGCLGRVPRQSRPGQRHAASDVPTAGGRAAEDCGPQLPESASLGVDLLDHEDDLASRAGPGRGPAVGQPASATLLKRREPGGLGGELHIAHILELQREPTTSR